MISKSVRDVSLLLANGFVFSISSTASVSDDSAAVGSPRARRLMLAVRREIQTRQSGARKAKRPFNFNLSKVEVREKF